MNSFDMLYAMVAIGEETCGIDHGRWTPAEECAAVDYLTFPMGYKTGEIEYTLNDYRYIPVCKDCAETIYEQDPEWNLLVCLGCGYCEWHLKAVSRYYSETFLIMIESCMHCE